MEAFRNPDILEEKSLISILAKYSIINILLRMSILGQLYLFISTISSELFNVSFFQLISLLVTHFFIQ